MQPPESFGTNDVNGIHTKFTRLQKRNTDIQHTIHALTVERDLLTGQGHESRGLLEEAADEERELVLRVVEAKLLQECLMHNKTILTEGTSHVRRERHSLKADITSKKSVLDHVIVLSDHRRNELTTMQQRCDNGEDHIATTRALLDANRSAASETTAILKAERDELRAMEMRLDVVRKSVAKSLTSANQ